MESITVRPCSVDEIQHAPNIEVVLDEYAAESAIPALAPHDPQWHTYQAAEDIGILRAVGAFQGDELVGGVLLMCGVLPHYGKRVATTESLFVTPEARRAGIGTQILREAKRVAAEMGAVLLMVSAPVGGKLEAVLDADPAYDRTNAIFVTVLE